MRFNLAKFVIAVTLLGAAVLFTGMRPMKTTFVFDMHYGPLIGLGWTANDFGDVSVATVTTDVPAGSYAIPVSGNFGLNLGILAAYQATDGDWYTFKIRGTSANQILSDRPLKAIGKDSKVGNAYKNDAHVNINGGAAVVDAFLRQVADPVLGRAREVEKVMRDTDAWAGAGVSFAAVADYAYPGADSVGFRAATVSTAGAGQAISPSVWLMGGEYIAKIPLNTGLSSGGKNTIVVSVEEMQADGSFATVGSKSFEGYAATYLAEVPFANDGTRQVRIKAAVESASSFYVGQIELDRIVGPVINVNTGKVVLLADSWGTAQTETAAASPIAQRFFARLTNAVFVPKGESGQRSDQMLSRFDTDITPEKPTTVIYIAGTNNFYQNIPAASYETDGGSIKSKIAGIDAQAVFFTPSVGAITFNPPQFFPSRTYEAYVRYLDYADPWPVFSYPWRFLPCYIRGCQLAPGETKNVYLSPGTVKGTQFLQFLNLDNAALQAQIGYAVGSNLADAICLPSGVTRKRWLRRGILATSGPLSICVTNPTNTAQDFTLSAEFVWRGDLS